MIKLSDKETGKFIGEITDDQLQYLIDQLEEETEEDMDYYINSDLLDVFEEKDIDPGLLSLLRKSLGDREDMEIVWTRE